MPARPWAEHLDWGPQLDEPLRLDALWDEADDPDWSDLMPMRPTLRTRTGEWDDLAEENLLVGKLSSPHEPKPTPQAEGLRRYYAEHRVSDETRAKQSAAAKKRQAQVAHIKRENKKRRSAEMRAAREAREAQERTEKASFAVSEPEPAPGPVLARDTCACGHRAGTHSRFGICTATVSVDGANYVCSCMGLNLKGSQQ